jgi:hypothetical protein
VVTVEIDPVVVEQRLGAGELVCPSCAGRLTGWGRARTRVVRVWVPESRLRTADLPLRRRRKPGMIPRWRYG